MTKWRFAINKNMYILQLWYEGSDEVFSSKTFTFYFPILEQILRLWQYESNIEVFSGKIMYIVLPDFGADSQKLVV